jgi:dCTP deaminase
VTILSAQSIRRLCKSDKPLLSPFVERGITDGRSFGLSACTYDCRTTQQCVLVPGCHVLLSTIERFCLPPNVCGSVLDKSSLARLGVSAMNTHLDPGWEGWLTVEIINFGNKDISISTGSPLCQVKFEWLDEPTELPYCGKYQNQENWPVKARRDAPCNAAIDASKSMSDSNENAVTD